MDDYVFQSKEARQFKTASKRIIKKLLNDRIEGSVNMHTTENLCISHIEMESLSRHTETTSSTDDYDNETLYWLG